MERYYLRCGKNDAGDMKETGTDNICLLGSGDSRQSPNCLTGLCRLFRMDPAGSNGSAARLVDYIWITPDSWAAGVHPTTITRYRHDNQTRANGNCRVQLYSSCPKFMSGGSPSQILHTATPFKTAKVCGRSGSWIYADHYASIRSFVDIHSRLTTRLCNGHV